jgi:siroheme decarboxylase
MEEIDRRILNIIQTGFPLTERPYEAVGRQVGLTEEDTFTRIEKMREEGVIRRIGAVFASGKLGFVSTLCAARVPEERVVPFVRCVNAHPGVTHNYRRNHEYNIWFTLDVRSEEELLAAIAELKRKTHVDDIMTMQAVRTFKINVNFSL